MDGGFGFAFEDPMTIIPSPVAEIANEEKNCINIFEGRLQDSIAQSSSELRPEPPLHDDLESQQAGGCKHGSNEYLKSFSCESSLVSSSFNGLLPSCTLAGSVRTELGDEVDEICSQHGGGTYQHTQSSSGLRPDLNSLGRRARKFGDADVAVTRLSGLKARRDADSGGFERGPSRLWSS